MADKIVVLQGGLIEQVGSPLELYERPCNLFVAQFIGSPRMNTVPGRVTAAEGGVAHIELQASGALQAPLRGAALPPGPVLVGIRPEHILVDAGPGVPGTVALAEHLGAETILHIDMADGTTLVARSEGRAPQRVGQAVTVTIDPQFCHLFDPAGPALVNAAGYGGG